MGLRQRNRKRELIRVIEFASVFDLNWRKKDDEDCNEEQRNKSEIAYKRGKIPHKEKRIKCERKRMRRG